MKNKIPLLILLLLTTACSQAQWQIQATYPEGTKTFKEIFFIDADNGWVADETGPYLYTTNGGENWYENTNAEYAKDIVFTSLDTGFICYEHEIKKTVNGGQDWNIIWQKWAYITDLSFADSQNAWAVWSDDLGIIPSSEDYGNTWQHTYTFSDMLQLEIYTLDLVAKDTGWVYMWRITGDFNEYTEIYKTEDGGDNWILKNDNPSRNLKLDMFFSNDTTGWLAGGSSGGYKLLHTSDNGQTWVEQELIGGEDIFRVTSVFFADDTTGWLGTHGISGSPDIGSIYYTTNTGITWIEQTEFDKFITDIFMINKNEGWAVSENLIYHYNDPNSIEEPEEESFDIIISPNPTNGIFTIALKNSPFYKGGWGDLIITDITGKTIYSTDKACLVSTMQIDISNQPAGFYFITISNNNHKSTKKLIKL